MLSTTVKRTILRHGMLDNVRTAGVAISGGVDSVCLFHLLRGMGNVVLIHVNHLLRGDESEADEEFVRALAARFDLPFHVKRVDVKLLGGNLEEEARRVRYEYYRECISAGVVDCVATGHTMSDQAETVLFRLLRGAHLAGLAGIHPVAKGPVIRPLIDVSRGEVEQYLRDHDETWRDDSSNRDQTFDRNRMRHTLLPELKASWNPELESSLAHLATLAFDEERFWSGWMEEHSREFLNIRGNIVLVSTSKLIEQPVAISRRLVRRAIECARGDLRSVDFAHVEAILELARRGEGNGRLQAPQVDVYRSFNWIRFAPLQQEDRLVARNQQTACVVPGRAGLPVAGAALEFEVVENTGEQAVTEVASESGRVKWYGLDWDKLRQVGPELCLRTWKPGDEYRPADESHGTVRKVKTMFQEFRIPLWERGTWPILTIGSQIVWARLFGPAEQFAAGAATRRILRVRELSDKE